MDILTPNKQDILDITYSHKETWNSFFLIFMVIGYIFGVVFYDFLPVSWIDELFCIFLIFVYLYRWKYYDVKYKKLFVGFILISLFYLAYSLYIKSNVPKAVISDYIVQIKPFIAFITVIGICPQIDKRKKKVLIRITYIIWGLLILVAPFDNLIILIFGHLSRFATTAIINGLIYYFCSDKLNKKEFIKLALMVGIGLFSTRTKFYGFYFLFCVILYADLKNYRFTLSLKNMILMGIILAGMLYVSWEKINFYFIQGAFEAEETFARPILYIVSGSIYKDYFPFGTGLASFATFFSGVYYSKTYSEYDIENFWGISEDFNAFIADTFYPSIAQLGVFGLVLYIVFFYWVFKTIKKNSLNYPNSNISRIAYLILLFFLIESTSDATFSQNRGFFMMILLGLCFNLLTGSDNKSEKKFTADIMRGDELF